MRSGTSIDYGGRASEREQDRGPFQGEQETGLPALLAGLQAIGRFQLENKVLAALLQWRPVPGFEPSAEAFAPNVQFVADVRRVVAHAVELGSFTQMR